MLQMYDMLCSKGNKVNSKNKINRSTSGKNVREIFKSFLKIFLKICKKQ